MTKGVWWFGMLVVAACNPTSGDEGTDSSTHWLDACDKDADCGAEWQCICGICAVECTTHRPCEDIAGNSVGVCNVELSRPLRSKFVHRGVW